jgi:hypothetical protein
VAYVDEAFLGEVADLLADGPPPALMDPSRTEVEEVSIDRVGHPPAVVVRYVHDGEAGDFRFELDDSAWSFDDAEEAAQLVWGELADSLESGE